MLCARVCWALNPPNSLRRRHSYAQTHTHRLCRIRSIGITINANCGKIRDTRGWGEVELLREGSEKGVQLLRFPILSPIKGFLGLPARPVCDVSPPTRHDVLLVHSPQTHTYLNTHAQAGAHASPFRNIPPLAGYSSARCRAH